MTILDAIRTLRKERGISFEQARSLAIEHFKKTGREVPESILRLHERNVQ